MTDTLPAGLTFNPANSSNGLPGRRPGRDVQLRNRDFGVGKDGPNFRARRSSVSHGATISNTASITVSESDATPNDHSSTVAVTVNRQANVSVIKSAPVGPVLAGSAFVYPLQVANSGPSDASGIILTDTLPAGLTFDSTLSTGNARRRTRRDVQYRHGRGRGK